MKLRIRGNSIRLRLGRSEVSQMISSGVVGESTTFDVAGRQRLGDPLVSDAGSLLCFCNVRGILRLPARAGRLAQAWGTTTRSGCMRSKQPRMQRRLRILIEKDLERIYAPVEESQEAAFPRPDNGVACSSPSIVGGPRGGLSLPAFL